MKIELKVCPYCKGTAKGYIKTMESFRKIHNYYVICTECGASTERYNTEFAMLQDRKFHVLTKKKRLRKPYMIGTMEYLTHKQNYYIWKNRKK